MTRAYVEMVFIQYATGFVRAWNGRKRLAIHKGRFMGKSGASQKKFIGPCIRKKLIRETEINNQKYLVLMTRTEGWFFVKKRWLDNLAAFGILVTIVIWIVGMIYAALTLF